MQKRKNRKGLHFRQMPYHEKGLPDPPGSPSLFNCMAELDYFAGRTCTCMKLFCALIDLIWMIVPVFGVITLPQGLTGS